MGNSKKFHQKKKPNNKQLAHQTRKPEKIISLKRDQKPIVESQRLSDLIKKTRVDHGHKNLNDLLKEQKNIMDDFERMQKDVNKIKNRPSYQEKKELAVVPYTPHPPALPEINKAIVPYQEKKKTTKKKKKSTKVCTNQTKTVIYQKKKSDGSKDKYYEMKQVYRKCNKKVKKRRKSRKD